MIAVPAEYDLRRLRLKGLIHRIPKTHWYNATSYGLKVAFFYAKLYLRILRPEWARVQPRATGGMTLPASGIRAVRYRTRNRRAYFCVYRGNPFFHKEPSMKLFAPTIAAFAVTAGAASAQNARVRRFRQHDQL